MYMVELLSSYALTIGVITSSQFTVQAGMAANASILQTRH
jgi:hypothetical protein